MNRKLRSLLGLALLVFLLNLVLSFQNVWPTPWITTHFEISAEAAAVVLLLALLAWRRHTLTPRLATALAWLVLLLILGRYVDVTAQALYGRPINLYWDSQHFPGVVAMLVGVASWWQLALIAAGTGLLVTGLIHVLRALLLAISVRLESPTLHLPVVVVSAALIGLLGFVVFGYVAPAKAFYTRPVVLSFGTQIFRLYRAASEQTRTTLQANPVLNPKSGANLRAIDRADILVMFIESYGVTTLDNPAHANALLAPRQRLADAVKASGRQVMSTRVMSPTFGGASWLAHSSFLSGYDVKDQSTYQQLLASQRDTWINTFAGNGYRTVGLLPGIRLAWPEGAFYEFDQIYDAHALNYRGPEFGWWRIPDQYSLARAMSLEKQSGVQAPVMMFFTTISSHAPFSPVAPYLEDWQALTETPYQNEANQSNFNESLAVKPDWNNLAPAYLDSISYALHVLAGYLNETKGRDQIVIVIGDHQPAAFVSGPNASLGVPVHVIAAAELLGPLGKDGFATGLTPQGPAVKPMHELTNQLLRAFSQTGVDVTRTITHTQ